MENALKDFEHYLKIERGLSIHTIKIIVWMLKNLLII